MQNDRGLASSEVPVIRTFNKQGPCVPFSHTQVLWNNDIGSARTTEELHMQKTTSRQHVDQSAFNSMSMPMTMASRIEKDIERGHISSEQGDVLSAQRQNVLKTIAAVEAHIKRSSGSGVDIFPSPSSSTVSRSIDANPYLPFPVITEVGEAPSSPNHLVALNTKATLFPSCKFRACQLCRPTFKDRAWQNIDEVCDRDYVPPPINFETDDRRISRMDLVSNLGLREYRLPETVLHTSINDMLSPSDDLKLATATLPRQLSTDFLASCDIASQKWVSERKSRRESMKRAFREMVERRKKLNAPCLSRPQNMDLGSEAAPAAFDIDLWRSVDDELIQEAARVPLPGQDGADDLDGKEDEVQVQEGIAVTEEGIDLGTADVIIPI